MIPSIFNKPYRTDGEMEQENGNQKRRKKFDARKLKLTLGDSIYKNVVEGIESGKKTWTKKEMIETVRGEGEFKTREWGLWSGYCSDAIGKIRRRYWNTKDPLDQRMFNFYRHKSEYWLIDIDDTLRSNVVFQDYQEKMHGYEKKDKALREGVYQKTLELDPEKRKRVIEELMANED